MRPIDEILVEHYASPTLITPLQKEQFADYLAAAERGAFEDFFGFLSRIQKAALTAEESLCRVTDILTKVVANTLLEIEKILGRDAKKAVLFSGRDSAKGLTQKHLKLILGLEAQIHALSDAALLLAPLRAELEAFLCSAELATDVTLRHIALFVNGIQSPTASVYRDLAHGDPSLFDTVNDQTKRLEEHAALLEETLSDLILSSSRAITAVNKKEQPETQYLNLLRAEQIRLHDINESLLRIRNEVQNVNAPDVL